jgi:hypothetical protein
LDKERQGRGYYREQKREIRQMKEARKEGWKGDLEGKQL